MLHRPHGVVDSRPPEVDHADRNVLQNLRNDTAAVLKVFFLPKSPCIPRMSKSRDELHLVSEARQRYWKVMVEIITGNKILRIQVNASPSLATDTAADFRLKFAMVDAALSLADVEGVYGGKPPASLNGFDLVWENGAAVQASLDCLGSQIP